MATSGSLSTNLNTSSGLFSRRTKATSSFPRSTSRARSTENPLKILTSRLGQVVAQDICGGRNAVHLVPRQEPDGEDRHGGLRHAPGGLNCRLRLGQRQPCVIQKGAAGGGEFDAPHTTLQELRADFAFEIAHLSAQRGLCRVQPLLGRELQAALLRDGDEVTKMPELHRGFYASRA